MGTTLYLIAYAEAGRLRKAYDEQVLAGNRAAAAVFADALGYVWGILGTFVADAIPLAEGWKNLAVGCRELSAMKNELNALKQGIDP